MPRKLLNVTNYADLEEEDRHQYIFMPIIGKTSFSSLNICHLKHHNSTAMQNQFPKRKLPHGKFSVTGYAPFVRLRRGKPLTCPVFTKRCFKFTMLSLPESISRSLWLSAISLVSLASFLALSASDYSGGESATIPTPNCCQRTYFLTFPNSDLKA